MDKEMRARLLECVQIAHNAATDASFDAAVNGRGFSYADEMAAITDSLIANGVTVVKVKKEKPPTDLRGKCGSCRYAEPAPGAFGTGSCYVNCTNKEHVRLYCQRPISRTRQRTAKGCRKYTPITKEGKT